MKTHVSLTFAPSTFTHASHVCCSWQTEKDNTEVLVRCQCGLQGSLLEAGLSVVVGMAGVTGVVAEILSRIGPLGSDIWPCATDMR
ncbi:hypothetical protein RvY_14018 [Ramazzottius varieornatus]|uniref:Uncharacterized protein n=1 Tax=Ramazzottius varieornatus TaxID=947166 RepID=A0A1D1VPX1_RAMVA|nr:hypothetical protein RvY_14018 [Ramazzottius varieornatus]